MSLSIILIYKYNPYLKEVKAKVRTNVEFVVVLTEYTKEFLRKTNISELVTNGVIQDKDKFEFELVSERHRVKQNKLLNSYEKGELEYISVINNWLKNEEKYFKTIYPIFDKVSKKEHVILSKPIENGSEDLVHNPMKIFISYCWEDKENDSHKDWIRSFANSLLNKRINVVLDQYELKLGSNMNHFMEKSIRESDKTLIIFTPGYKAKAEARLGGIGYEHSIITSELYNDQLNSKHKFIPILRAGTRQDSVPAFMKQYVSLDMTDDNKYEERLEDLVRELYDKPRFQKPPLGNMPNFD